ncbi:MAG: hypothetical protein WCP97_09820, partial [bacterium]
NAWPTSVGIGGRLHRNTHLVSCISELVIMGRFLFISFAAFCSSLISLLLRPQHGIDEANSRNNTTRATENDFDDDMSDSPPLRLLRRFARLGGLNWCQPVINLVYKPYNEHSQPFWLGLLFEILLDILVSSVSQNRKMMYGTFLCLEIS